MMIQGHASSTHFDKCSKHRAHHNHWLFAVTAYQDA
jgi:hypothetical protein